MGSAPYTELPNLPPTPVLGHNQKPAVRSLGALSHHAGRQILDFSASRIPRNKFLPFVPHSDCRILSLQPEGTKTASRARILTCDAQTPADMILSETSISHLGQKTPRRTACGLGRLAAVPQGKSLSPHASPMPAVN